MRVLAPGSLGGTADNRCYDAGHHFASRRRRPYHDAGRAGGPSPTTTTSSTAPTTATATGTVTPVCATAHLSLSDLGGQGAAGHSIITYQFTNTSSTPCTLTGYPGVSILNAQSQIVQHPATRVPGPGTTTPIPVTTITMAGGSHAVFVLSSTDTVPNPDCPTPYYGTKLRVYPPGNTQPLQLPFTGAFCDLVIGPVHSP